MIPAHWILPFVSSLWNSLSSSTLSPSRGRNKGENLESEKRTQTTERKIHKSRIALVKQINMVSRGWVGVRGWRVRDRVRIFRVARLGKCSEFLPSMSRVPVHNWVRLSLK